jgi:2-dehydropantoate 2-reductase
MSVLAPGWLLSLETSNLNRELSLQMRHAIVGAGGVGGLVAAALVHAGEQVTLILRPETYAEYPDHIRLESTYENVEAPVARTTELNSRFDIVWLAVKATQLEAAISTLVAGRDNFGIIVPLLNGVEHIERLRALFGHDRVVPATISVESERVAPGHIVHRSPFVHLAVAASGQPKLEGILKKLSDFGFSCEFVGDENTLLWRKLIFLAPLALTSSASGKTTGEMKEDPVWNARLQAAVREAGAVALAEGAAVDVGGTLNSVESLPPDMRSSMQKDVEAGRTPELDAIAGPIVRGGRKHGVPTPVIGDLVARIQNKTGVA